MENNTENNNQQTVEQKNNEKKGFKKYLSFAWELLKIILIALIIVVPIRYFIFQPFIVSGSSMAPNFATGDYLIVDEISYRFSAPQRGDVIVFYWPKDTREKFIKRLIGLPGETVDITNGQVEIIKNGKTQVLDEKYLPSNLKTYPDSETILKSGEYFMMGDNREYSYDSRAWGVVPAKDIIGKALLRIFPVTAFSEIPHVSY